MKVSIITATFNSESTIDNCLKSVSSQSYEFIEHIIIDSCSNDKTLDIIREHQKLNPALIYISEPDNGIYDALNKGIKMATGNVIGFVHSDDLLAGPSTIERIVNAFQTFNTDGVYGDLMYVDLVDIKKTVRYWKSSIFTSKSLRKGWMPPHPTLYLKKEVYNELGGFNTNLKIAADYDFILRTFSINNLKFSYIPEVLVLMRVGGASNKSLKNILVKSRKTMQP